MKCSGKFVFLMILQLSLALIFIATCLGYRSSSEIELSYPSLNTVGVEAENHVYAGMYLRHSDVTTHATSPYNPRNVEEVQRHQDEIRELIGTNNSQRDEFLDITVPLDLLQPDHDKWYAVEINVAYVFSAHFDLRPEWNTGIRIHGMMEKTVVNEDRNVSYLCLAWARSDSGKAFLTHTQMSRVSPDAKSEKILYV